MKQNHLLSGYQKKIFSFLTSKKENEIQSLNGLRATSIFLIFGVHTWGFFIPTASNETLTSLPAKILMNLTSGVDLFLILSGFLISLGLKKDFEKNGKVNFSLFFQKRIFRIFPAYYSFLFISVIIFLYYKVPFRWEGILIDSLYLSNYMPGQMPHTWSLALEEQFYLIFPFFASFLLFRLHAKSRFLLLLLLYLLPLLARYSVFSSLSAIDEITYAFKIYKPAHTRMDAILTGILLMELYTEQKQFLLRITSGNYAILTGLAAALLLFYGHADSHTGSPLLQSILRYNFINLGYGLIFLLALGNNSLANILSWSVFRPAARLSYTMYLWHFILGGIGARMVPGLELFPFQWKMFFYSWLAIFLLILIFAIMPFALIEFPFLQKKDHLQQR